MKQKTNTQQRKINNKKCWFFKKTNRIDKALQENREKAHIPIPGTERGPSLKNLQILKIISF